MIIPDANLLIYAHDALAPEHRKAYAWWRDTLSGHEPVGLPWIVLLAFTRMMTHPTVSRQPLGTEQVREIIDDWVQAPCVRIIQISDRALPVFFDLLQDARMGGNLSTDALIAVHAREHSATIYSNDRDFDRFRGIKWVNPLR
ncbi:MAG TPA: TA system VapC family ribonuclease toxin [Opitutales bacterium]|nr:TA system VapC family ribonuclease toxin [Opitutales bacterium]